MQLVIGILQFVAKAVDKWVLGGAEAPPNFWHFYVKCIAHTHSTQLFMICRAGGVGLVDPAITGPMEMMLPITRFSPTQIYAGTNFAV